MPAWAFGALFAGYSLMNIDASGNIGHAGHFGGILAGWTYFIICKRF